MDNMDYIENYFTGEPDASQSKEFEERIITDPGFAEDVAFYMSARQVAGDTSRSEKKLLFKEIYRNTKIPRPTPVRKLVYYFAAAAVAAGIIFGTYTITHPVSPTELANQYIKSNLENLGVKMGGSADSIQGGLRLYNDGKMTEALATFERIARIDTSNFNAKKYAGISALRLKEYEKALSYFEHLEIYNGRYSNPALILQAVTLMERDHPGDIAKAKLLLQKVVANDLEGKEMAVEWLKKM
jgi:tetratricopeptide (TPR) repeat protein